MDGDGNMTFEEYRRESSMRTWKYKIVIEERFRNIQYIHPLKQKEVWSIIRIAQEYGVQSVRIFGSSITSDCTIRSDTDICLEYDNCMDEEGVFYPEISKMMKELRSVCRNGCDIVFANLIGDSDIAKDALGGVLVYVQNDK